MKLLVLAYTDDHHRKPQLLLCCPALTLNHAVHVKLGLTSDVPVDVNILRLGLLFYDIEVFIRIKKCLFTRFSTKQFFNILNGILLQFIQSDFLYFA